jgi:glycosyltransferase involved in cell wall biosynthesis
MNFQRIVEIIVINDGSNDNTYKIIKKYEYKDIIKILTKENGGVSSARNAGIRIARGRYITFIDGDDWVSDNYLLKICSYISDYNNPDMVIFNFYRKTFLRGKAIELIADSQLPLEWKFIKYPISMNSVCNKVFKSDIIRECGIFFDEYVSASEDLLFVIQIIIYCSKILFINDVLYYYRLNRYSVTQNLKWKHIKNTLFVTKQIESILQKMGTAVKKKYSNFLIYQKLFAKRPFLSEVKFYNQEQWRVTFPEVNKFAWSCSKNIFDKILYAFVILRLSFVSYMVAFIAYYIKLFIKKVVFNIDEK